MNRDKLLLRTWLKTKRLAISKDEIGQWSLDVNKKLIDQFKFENFKLISCYRPIKSLNEVNTETLLEYLSAKHPDIEVDVQDQSVASAPAEKKYDLIIVPTLGFDKQLHRIGWGGGWYDQFLKDQSRALKVGLCFQMGLVEKGLPHEPHDISLDIVITEEAIIKRA